MLSRLGRRWLVAAAAVVTLTLSTASGDFQLVEDFEGLMLGPIDGQNGWNAENQSSTVTTDPIGGANQVLSVITESTHLYKGVLLANETARMLFLRFRFGSQINYSFGMTDISVPSRFDHFDCELGMANSSNELRINDGGNYDILTMLQPNTWYNCWVFIDNINDTSQVWLHARGLLPATGDDQLDSEGQTVFQFRNVHAGNLVNFFIKTGGGSGLVGPLYLDTMYLEDTSALNLDNPAMPPTGSVESAAGTALVLAPACPNPFRGQTTLRFAVSPGEDARLLIHDLAGRCVTQLAVHGLAGAEQAVVWEGRDQSGHQVASGIYFLRLEAAGQILTRSVVVTK